MRWTTLNFGKHKGKTLPQVMFFDPDWFFHGWESGYFKWRMRMEAAEIYRKASAIRVPPKNGEKRFVEYIIDQGTGKFGTLHIIEGDLELYDKRSGNFVQENIDMRFLRQISVYDKTGYNNFLSAMKAILFGDKSHKMTKKRCENFFEDEDNFLLEKTVNEATVLRV